MLIIICLYNTAYIGLATSLQNNYVRLQHVQFKRNWQIPRLLFQTFENVMGHKAG
jgi:hypothetical protein